MSALSADVVRWAVETGLGPLLLRGIAADPETSSSPLWELVHGAALTARFLADQQLTAMADIVDACQGTIPVPVLLKGISLCEQHYPEPHLRPMRDIDFLVEAEAIPDAESILRTLGYQQWSERPAAFYRGHHHSCPFVHPETGVWVDVHRGLFAPGSQLGEGAAFAPDRLRAEFRWSQFQGRRVRRLSDELQIVYLACHWARGLRAVGGMVAMADLGFLLNNTPGVDWPRIWTWTNTAAASRYVALLLTYLDTHRVVDLAPHVRAHLASRQTPSDHLAFRVAHRLLDRYVAAGCDFGTLMSEHNFHRLWKLLVLRDGRPRDGLLPWLTRRPTVVTATAAAPPSPEAADGAAGSGLDAVAATTTLPKEVMTMSKNGADPSRAGESAASLYPRRRPGVRVRTVDGEMLILDRQRHLVHQVNQTAGFIWDRCDGEHTILHIARELARHFDVDPPTAARDVGTAIRQLESAGLVQTRPEWEPKAGQARRA